MAVGRSAISLQSTDESICFRSAGVREVCHTGVRPPRSMDKLPRHTEELQKNDSASGMDALTRTHYSGSVGSLNSDVNLILPCPNCGKLGLAGSPGSKFDAVSSGGNNTSELRSACNDI